MNKDLLSISDLSPADLLRILDKATELKARQGPPLLAGKSLGMIFEKPSLRTRVSFDIAMFQLGGHAVYLSSEEVGLNKREPIADVAQVLSRYVDIIMARTFAHRTVQALAQYAPVPVINGLSDREHPCQAVADVLTIREKKGRLAGVSVTYVGDGNNVAASLMLACVLAGANFRIASPPGYDIPMDILDAGRSIAATTGCAIDLYDDPLMVVRNADVVYTDVWTSMGQEQEHQQRQQIFAPYQITPQLLSQARSDAILMHPMPVHHGEEFAEGMINSPQSVLIDQAENRLHAQKAILVALSENRS